MSVDGAVDVMVGTGSAAGVFGARGDGAAAVLLGGGVPELEEQVDGLWLRLLR